jgi:hypothetical protein
MWVEGQWVPAAVMAGPVSYGPPTAPEVVVEEAPPAPMVETYGPAPGPDFFWITGRWARVGGRWSWAGGRWERHPHPHPGGAWIAGHWNHGPHGYVWIEGRWR